MATTNNRMELQAAIEALHVMHTSPRLTMFTDSRYVIDGLTKWLQAWKRRGWVTATNTPVKNQDLWMALERLNHPGVRWQHVYGHRGDPNNERVDTIARTCATGASPMLFCGEAGSAADPVVVLAAAALQPSPPVQTLTRSPARSHAPGPIRYVSIVQGVVAIHSHWASCAARVQGVSGARYRKVRTPEELAAFCATHGVEPPPAT